MKKIQNFILILCICFFGFGCNIIPDDYPFDNLGGGGIADDEEERVTGDDVISNEEVEIIIVFLNNIFRLQLSR